jgi:hypothetical protein
LALPSYSPPANLSRAQAAAILHNPAALAAPVAAAAGAPTPDTAVTGAADGGGAADLVRRCLDPDPARRPPAWLLLHHHPFLLAQSHSLLPALLPASGRAARPSLRPATEPGGGREAWATAVWGWGAAAGRGWAWAVGLEGGFADGAAEAAFVREWHGESARRARSVVIACIPVRC